ncbi:protein DENND6B isoform X1 [Homo sapiens]|uniref:protein DENND6B isoform X1 n=1 Tax=Homo sapiens TaxID=9606 RepID=UPI0005D02CB5|nr:protein DENND6B isoform X1 [Homo sapiens]XP_054181590.1 protein DENND6B isoform X1 [Homo sapiens]|eukprot:XP_011528994.1 protein DENND6B isoform X2 [Homo sapiens]
MDALLGTGPRRARGCLGAAGPTSSGRAARTPAAPWARFSAWLECVCVVTFDLELGQALELVYPNDFRLTDKEKSSICYLSFPDSHSGCLGDTQFSFRMRQCGGQRSPWHADDRHYNSRAPVALQREPAHYFGYVYFRQVKDSSVKRGYFQKALGSSPTGRHPGSSVLGFLLSNNSGVQVRRSWGSCPVKLVGRATLGQLQSLVLVSRLPFVRLFQALLSLIAPEYFDKLAPCLEAVCSEIDQWPAPAPGQTLNLPVMGVVVQVRIPSRVDKSESSPPKQFDQENLLPAPVVLASVHELDLFRCFRPVLTHMQTLWELMLLGEPLLVLAPSPDVSSEMVLALTSCLQPLRFCCDFRPYFTIHDSEFKEFTTRTQAPPNVVLGVTNPFFIKTLQHWPHILRVGEPKMSGDLPKQVKLKKPSRLKTLDTKPGLYTAYTAHLHRDKALLKRLLKGVQKKRPSDVQSALLRRHLLELTQSFIIPLEHYMASLMPLQKSITPWKTPPQIQPFSQDDFLRSLEHAGPQLTCILKGDWLGLYRCVDCRRFFKSPHFDGWYRQRHKEMALKLEALHLEAICEANIETWMKDKSEVEVVDLVLKLREKLVRAQGHQLPVKEATLQRAQLYIETVIGSLPKDLQAVLCPP